MFVYQGPKVKITLAGALLPVFTHLQGTSNGFPHIKVSFEYIDSNLVWEECVDCEACCAHPAGATSELSNQAIQPNPSRPFALFLVSLGINGTVEFTRGSVPQFSSYEPVECAASAAARSALKPRP